MRRSTLCAALLLAATAPLLGARTAGALPGGAQTSCAVCHGKEAREHQSSVHARGGVTCVECHGGVEGPLEVAEAHGADLRSLRGARAGVESCGGCHADVKRMRAFGLRTDQLSLYWTSKHGERLAQEGDPKVATCTTCHDVHAVLSAKNPLAPISRLRQVDTCGHCHADAQLMAEYGIPSDVVAKYRGSVHGRALLEEGHASAPSCTDCHGSHGAAPPHFEDIQQVCGHCHSTVQQYFAQSPHVTRRPGQATVECTSCHSNHDVAAPSAAMFLGEEPGHCGACHMDESDPARAVGLRLSEDVERLAATIRATDAEVRAAGGRGLFLGAEKSYIDEARGLLVRSRAMTHTLTPRALEDVLNRGQGMIGQTRDGLATKNRVFRDRRIYTGIFLGISLAFAIVLWMYGLEIRGRGLTRARFDEDREG